MPSLVIVEALRRRSMLKFMLGGAGLLAWPHSPALAQSKEKVFRIAMSLSDIPVTRGQADGGAAGSRFINRSIYDALLTWDLSQGDRPSNLKPNLAVSWSVDPANQNIWTFKLRRGVKYHDGSLFTAHDVVWNFEKLKNPKSPQYDPLQVRNGANWLASIKSYRAVDDHTLEITTKTPTATLLYALSNIFLFQSKAMGKTGPGLAEICL